MKAGAIDIPALKIKIVCGDGVRFDRTENAYNCDIKNVKIYDFEQVDGITFRNFFDIFNRYSSNRLICVFTCYDRRHNGRDGLDIHVVNTVYIPIEDCYLDREISEVIEELILGYQTDDPKFIDFVNVFCTRYRGRDKAFLMEKKWRKPTEE